MTDPIRDGDAHAPIVELNGLVKHFPVGRNRRGERPVVHAVDGVDLLLRSGESLAIVGESGCGKSTVAKLIMGLIEPTEGRVAVGGHDVVGVDKHDLAARRRVAVVNQNPWSALNRSKTIRHIVTQPLQVHRLVEGKQAREARAADLLETVGLPTAYLDRRPRDISGGELQRVTIARALAVEPEVLVLDEPTASLDVSVKATLVNVLTDLREQLGLTYVLITHELDIARHLADRVAVMYLGQFVETGPLEAVFDNPRHPYTQSLLAAAPSTLSIGHRPEVLIGGEVPSAVTPPSGCRFHTRCRYAVEACLRISPSLEPQPRGGAVACLRVEEMEESA